MGKEPAGLRRWRLAHRKHKKAKKQYKVYKREMRIARGYTLKRRRSYRGRKSKGRRGSKAIAVLPMVVAVMPAWNAYKIQGFNQKLPEELVLQYTGFSTSMGKFADTSKPVALLGGMVVAIIGHKVASKFGINRQIKKLTGGYLQL